MKNNVFRRLTLSICGLALLSSGCSLLLDFTQCEVDEDCPNATALCVDGICEAPERVMVTDVVVEDTTWTSDKVWVLDNLILVIPPATLTIEPGTTVLGQKGTGLASLAGARLEAEGTRDNPIVFTSDKPVGQRVAGDWAGIGMVGRARVNREDFALRIEPGEFDTGVGGSDDEWNCGTLKYVRIEFGGSEIDGQDALDAVALAGCGSDTTIEYVQTHFSNDDGFGVFGGTVDLRHVVSTRSSEDAYDFDTAWRGTAQFVAAQFDVRGQEAMEVENLAEEPTAEPMTDARVYNFTLIGADREGDVQVGLYPKLGGMGTFSHGIIMGYKNAALYIDGPEAAEHATNGELIVRDTLFYNSGERGEGYFDLASNPREEDDPVFQEYSTYETDELNNKFGLDPGLEDPYDLSNPGWVPDATNTTGRDIDPPPEPFDPTAVYRGAFAPGAAPWTEGWTAYPLN